jgi:hypothetical protein
VNRKEHNQPREDKYGRKHNNNSGHAGHKPSEHPARERRPPLFKPSEKGKFNLSGVRKELLDCIQERNFFDMDKDNYERFRKEFGGSGGHKEDLRKESRLGLKQEPYEELFEY